MFKTTLLTVGPVCLMFAFAGCIPTVPMPADNPAITPPASQPSEPVEPAPPVETAPPVEVEAGVGVGEKGRELEGEDMNKIIATPAVAYFRTKEKLVFEVQIPQAMQLYQATNGKGIESHEEFMQKIVKEQNIVLPELPEGDEYKFDPETQKLMVMKRSRG